MTAYAADRATGAGRQEVNAALPTLPLYAALGAIVAWLAIGTLGLAAPRQLRFVSRVLFPLGAAVGLGLAIVAFLALGDAPVDARPAARPAGPAVPRAARSPVGVLPADPRRRGSGDLAVLGGLLPLERGHGAGAHLLPVPRVPRGHGGGAGGRRRLPVHGRVGDDGLVVLLPRHHRAPHPGDPAGGLPLPADRARRRDRHPALLRRPAGRNRRLHVRRHALGDTARRVAERGIPAGAVRVRREGRTPAPARVAPGGPSRGALAGFGTDERRDAEDRDLRPASRHLRPARQSALVVGCRGALARPRHRALRRHLRRGADRHEAPARVLVDREHRHHRRRHRARGAVLGLREGPAVGDRHDRGALPRAQPRVLQEPAVPRHGLGAALDPRAQPRQARRPDPPHALGGVARAGRHPGDRRTAAVERLRVGVAAAAGIPVHAQPAAVVRQHAGAARRGGARARRRAGRLRHGQVLRRHLPRAAARAQSRQRARRRPLRARRALPTSRRAASCWASSPRR